MTITRHGAQETTRTIVKQLDSFYEAGKSGIAAVFENGRKCRCYGMLRTLSMTLSDS